MKKGILTVLILLLSVFCLASAFIGVYLNVFILDDVATKDDVAEESEFDSYAYHTVNIKVLSNRDSDNMFFIKYIDPTGCCTAYLAQVAAGEEYTYEFDVLSSVSFDEIYGEFDIYIDGELCDDSLEIDITDNTQIELVLL